jgi:hypothetical protein
MKKNPSVAKAIDPAKPVHATPGDEAEDDLESLNLSPDSLADRASTTTSVLSEILERDERSYTYRYWGINE